MTRQSLRLAPRPVASLLAKLSLGLLLVVGTQVGCYHALHRVLHRPHDVAETHGIQDAPGRILFVGDSSTFASGSRDTIRNGVPEMLQAELPSRSIVKLSHSAYHLGLFLRYVQFLDYQGRLPQTLIVPINLSQFSPLWQNAPRYQFVRESLQLQYGINPWVAPFLNFLFAFKAFELEPISDAAFHQESLWRGATPAGRAGDLKHVSRDNATNENVRQYFIGWYMKPIAKDNLRLDDLRSLARLAKRTHREAFFYTVPLDYLSGTTRVGEDFVPTVRANLSLIRETLRDEGTDLLDLAMTLSSEHFIWPEDEKIPSEHLYQSGRAAVAAKLSAWIGSHTQVERATAAK